MYVYRNMTFVDMKIPRCKYAFQKFTEEDSLSILYKEENQIILSLDIF